ncbi:MAG: type II toxin-antitoxin system mRNA interferase toxin, RelE/StbE family [Patescibacteria group bacterium]
MIVRFHRNFEKQYRKLNGNQKNKFQERLKVFLYDEFNPTLNNHPLRGHYQGYRSINVTGDLRAVYKRLKDAAVFVAIDIHSNLYR